MTEKETLPGFQNAETYTPEELQRLFIRNCCDGYGDEKLIDSKSKITYALINQGNMKEWFEWLSSLKIIKDHGNGIL